MTFRSPPLCPQGNSQTVLPARIEGAHSDRARSASKEGTWPLPPPPLGP